MARNSDTEAAQLAPVLAEEAAIPTFSQRAAGLAELVRDHPKTAIAAGAALAAGVAAAAAIPLARRGRAKANGKSNGATPPRSAVRARPKARKPAAKTPS